jgi:hypothetical protein
MNELDQNIPSEDMGDPPVTTDLLIKRMPQKKKKQIHITPDTLYDNWNILSKDEYPDAKLHKYVSFIKSFVRIVGCVFGGFGMFVPAFISFGIAEVIGIVEEMV